MKCCIIALPSVRDVLFYFFVYDWLLCMRHDGRVLTRAEQGVEWMEQDMKMKGCSLPSHVSRP